ncbi:hypothetical protein [Ohtaekwangia sp.]|uniref:hypothetical protein n=1 Tax=Ohtaekwangia sp. TaxID=2066019 RepID=UPI002F91D528
MKPTVLRLAWALSFLASWAVAQPYKNDTAFVATASANAVKHYHETIKGQSQLYNGSDYAEYQTLREEHPYFGSNDWVFGSVHYDGYLYEDVPLLYDLMTDEILTESFSRSSTMRLIKSRVKYFTISDKKFVNLSDSSLHKGFYELLYNGKTKVYARHFKLLQETISQQEITHDFEEKIRYYIYKDGKYFPVRSKGSIQDVFRDQKHELNQLMSKNKIRFRKNREQYIIRMAEFYDRIQPQP